MFISYLLIDRESRDGEDIDHFAMPQGVLKPRFKSYPLYSFSEFRIDNSGSRYLRA